MDTTKDLFLLYYDTVPGEIETLDLCRGDSDFRKVYIADDGTRKLVIKHSSNSFTDAERIHGWQRLIAEYNKLGIYCPDIVPNKNGDLVYQYTENERTFYVHAEEFAKFSTVEQIGRNKLNDSDGQPIYLADLMRSIGKVAKERYDILDWPSQFCLLEQHSPLYKFIDETTQAAERFAEIIKNTLPEFNDRMSKIMAVFYETQKKLQKVYSQLPVSCFQGDLNDTNILVDEHGNFTGVIDFNVCGREPVLNYAVREALMHIENSILFDKENNELYFYNNDFDEIRINSFLKNIGYIQEYYEFNKFEREVFPILFRYINLFWWEQVNAIRQISSDREKVKCLFDWLEYQMTRDDIRLP